MDELPLVRERKYYYNTPGVATELPVSLKQIYVEKEKINK